MDDLISRSALHTMISLDTKHGTYGEFMDGSEVSYTSREVHAMINDAPAVDAVEVIRCKDCKLWDREHIEMHSHSDEHPEQQAEFAECLKWSTWSTCFMTRSDDYCSQAKKRRCKHDR